ncbi:serine hydrolase [Planctomycetaceae bacterium SH139]
MSGSNEPDAIAARLIQPRTYVEALWRAGIARTRFPLSVLPKRDIMQRFLCWLTALFLLTHGSSPAQQARGTTDYSSVTRELEAAILYELESKQLPALSFALVADGQTLWSAGFGFVDSEQKVPASADSVYRVGSISKLFTDIAVMRLVERGMLDLDAPVTDYLPAFQPENPYQTPITLRQLMSHRSGLVRESPVGNYFDPSEPSLAETVDSLNQTSLVYPPETKTKYSNAALAVVGAVLESQIDSSHPAWVQQQILQPLGMAHSGFELSEVLADHASVGWMHTYDGRRFPAPSFLLGTGPAGNMFSSVTDLAKFSEVLLANDEELAGEELAERLLSPGSLNAMTSVGDSVGEQGFGLGFYVDQFAGQKRIGHGGAVYGFSTQLTLLPEKKLGVVAVSNLDGSNGVVKRLVDHALLSMLAVQAGEPLPSYERTTNIPPSRAAELVGRYQRVDGEEVVTVNELAGRVYMQYGSFRRELKAFSKTGEVVVDDLHGFGIPVQLAGNDQIIIAGKRYETLPDEPPADAPERWNGLIGEYGWDHNTLYILEESGRLYALIEWFYYYPLSEVSENVFAFPDRGLYHGEQLVFTRDAFGRAVSVVAAEVNFERRSVGTPAGETFKIKPVLPMETLQASALAAKPPSEVGQYRASELVDLSAVDASIQLDIRYATTNNFMGAVFYQEPRAFMQRPAAEAVQRANQQLRSRGLGLLIHDAYRPWYVTKMFWDATPASMKDFVANPANGSRHNRGCAVDLTLSDLQTGDPIEMVAGYDEFSQRSFPLYPGGTTRQRWYRDMLRRTMEANQFTVYEYEWWHFDFADWKQYRIGNKTFAEIQ